MTIATELYRLLSKGVTGNQVQLVQALQDRGITTTQSSVSRALRKINAIKAQDGSGNTVWALGRPEMRETGFFDSLVSSIAHNNFLIVVHTRPGTANTVAKFIDEHNFDSIIGSVAGDDTIVIVPADVKNIPETVEKISLYMKEIGILHG